MRRNEMDLTSQAVRNLLTNPAMKIKSAGTDTVLINYAATPSFEGTSSVTSSVGGNPAQWATSGQATDKAHSGSKSFKLGNCTVAGQAARKGNTATGSMKVMKGQKISWSFWIYSTAAGNLSPYWEGAKVSDGSYTGGGSSLGVINVPANRWTYCYGTSTASADAFVHGAGGYNLPVTVGDSVWWDDFCITLTDTPVPYFDGDTPASDGYTYAWSGTPYNSTSVRKSAASVVRTNLVANPSFKGGTLSNIRTNLLTNPSFESNTGNTDVWTNNIMNPSFRNTSGNVTIRTNLLSNPSAETASTSLVVRTNLATNPSFENVSATTLVTRTNLAQNPACEVNANGWSNNDGTKYSTARSTVSPISGTASFLSTRLNASLDVAASSIWVNGQADGVLTSLKVTPGKTLTWSMDIKASNANRKARVYVAYRDAAGASLTTSAATESNLTAGIISRISHTHIVPTGADAAILVVSVQTTDASLAVAGETVLHDNLLIEESATVGTYFDGANPIENLCTNPSFATNTTGYTSVSAGLVRVTDRGGDGHVGELTQTIDGGTRQSALWIMTGAAGNYGVSFDFKGVAAEFTNVRCFLYDTASATVVSQSPSPTAALIKDGNYNRYSFTLTAASSFDRVYMEVLGTAIPIGTKAWIDRVVIEKSANPRGAYYEGQGDFSYAWAGTVNASISYQKGFYVSTLASGAATGFSSTEWKGSSGSKSLRITPTLSTTGDSFCSVDGDTGAMRLGMAAGKTYTFSATCRLAAPQTGSPGLRARTITLFTRAAGSTGSYTEYRSTQAPNVAGEYRVSLTQTLPADTGEAFLRLYNGTTAGNGDVWWDDLLVEESPIVRPYFDGATPVPKNLATDPRATSNFTGVFGAGWRNTRWFGTGSPAGTYTFVTGASDGPVPGLSTYLRKQWTAAASSNGDTGFEHTTGNHFPVKAGTTYTVSSYLRANGQGKQQSRISIGWKDGAGNTISTDYGPSISLPYQRWVRNYITATAPANALYAVILSDVDAGTAWAVNEYLDGTGLMIEEGSTLSFYEDSTLTDYTYAWTGTAQASSSTQSAVQVSGATSVPSLCRAFQSNLVYSTGSKSLRVHGTSTSTDVFAELNNMLSGYTFKANTTYTLSGDRHLTAPLVGHSAVLSRVSINGELPITLVTSPANVAGKSRFVVRFTTNSGTGLAFVRVYASVPVGGGEVWFDNLILEEGITDGSYFDGSTPAFENIAMPTATALSGVTHTTNVSYGGYTWTRAAVAAGTGGWISRQYADINKMENGATYTASVTVANDQTFNQSVSIDWVDGSGSTHTIAPGETKRISVTGSRSTPYDNVFKFADLQVNQNATQASSILFKDWLIEKGSTSGAYYSGTGDFTYAWSGTAHASTSTQKAPAVVGNIASKSGAAGYEDAHFTTYQAIDDISGKKIGRWVSRAGTPSSQWRIININNQSLNYSSLVAGSTYTMIMRYRASGWSSTSNVYFALKDGTSLNPVIGDDTARLINTNGWVEYRRTFVALINGLSTTNLYITLPITPQATTDGIFDIAEWALVPGYYTGPFFDGSSAATTTDYVPTWSGTADASVSTLRGTAVSDIQIANFGDNNAKAVNSTEWSASTGKSLRIVPVGINGGTDTAITLAGSATTMGPFVAGKTYTVKATFRQAAPQTGTLHSRARGIMFTDSVVGWSAAPVVAATNTAGSQTLTHTFTVNSAATWATVRLYNGASAGNGDVWWDDVVLVEGPYTDGYFDGNTAAAGDFSYAWAGTANASQSYQKAIGLSAWTKETKLATWVTSSGTLRIDVIDPNGGGGRSIVPWSSQDVNLSLTSGKKYTVVARGRKLDSGTGYRVAGSLVGELPFTTSMSTVTLTLTAGTGPVYLEHPSSRNTAGTEWEYFGIFEEGDPIAYFDGDTTGSDGLLYRWKGTANVSQSEQIGTPISGFTNEPYIRNWALPDGAMRVVNITGSSHSLQTPTNIVVSGRQYTVLMRARHYKGGTLKVYGLENTPTLNFNSSYSWVRVSGKAIDTRLYFSSNSGISGAGVDISHLMIVEGTYAGEYLDGNWYNARWDGTEHQSSSVGYPSTLASIAGKPTRETTVTQGNLATTNPPAGFGARTIYFVYETLGTSTAYQGPCTYGTTATGRISLQTQNTGSNQMGIRFDFPGGESNKVFTFNDARLMGTHVIAISLSADMTKATICVDGGTDYIYTIDPGTGWAGNDYVGVGNMSETIGHNVVVYNTEQDRNTRLAIMRHLGNKYDATVS